MAAVDIVAFGDHRRDSRIQLHLRHHLYRHLQQAFDSSNICWADCYHEDRGDGALIIIPPDLVAEDLLVPLAYHLAGTLRRHNQLASQIAQLRLRLAVHTGRIYRDTHGIAGTSVNHLFRLLEADTFKQALSASGADLGMIVSDRLYTDITEHGTLIAPQTYQPLHITCKETQTRAWAWFSPPGTV